MPLYLVDLSGKTSAFQGFLCIFPFQVPPCAVPAGDGFPGSMALKGLGGCLKPCFGCLREIHWDIAWYSTNFILMMYGMMSYDVHVFWCLWRLGMLSKSANGTGKIIIKHPLALGVFFQTNPHSPYTFTVSSEFDSCRGGSCWPTQILYVVTHPHMLKESKGIPGAENQVNQPRCAGNQSPGLRFES